MMINSSLMEHHDDHGEIPCSEVGPCLEAEHEGSDSDHVPRGGA